MKSHRLCCSCMSAIRPLTVLKDTPSCSTTMAVHETVILPESDRLVAEEDKFKVLMMLFPSLSFCISNCSNIAPV